MFKSQTLIKQQHLIEQLTRDHEVCRERVTRLETENVKLRDELARLESVKQKAIDLKRSREQELEEAISRHREEQDVLSSAKASLESRYERLVGFFKRFKKVVHTQEPVEDAPVGEDLSYMSRELEQILERVDAFRNSVSTIKKISDQLELLGVNATIQAAHAGENGKGFLIVADEINKLSGHSKKSVEEALQQLTLFSEIAHGLSRDFSQTAGSIEGNLDAFNELHALYEAHAPKDIKDQCETSDRM